ncbi:MAG: oligosaccharide repeat unit polymerase, partial [Crenarchaeota archaeon]|nr:oligosaccharide repeat unit polymerase [Thermoproteota archaeon]
MLKLIVFFLFICALFISQRGDKMSPLFVYITIWGSILFLYELHLFAIYDIHDNTSIVIGISVFSFIIGGAIVNNRKTLNNKSYDEEKYEIDNNRIRILVILLFMSSIGYYYQLVQSLMSNGWHSQINKLLLATGEIDSGGPLTQFFVRPFEFIIIPISTYYLINKHSDKLIAFSGIYFATVKFICTGSKAMVIYYVISLAITYIHYSEKKKRNYTKIMFFSFVGGIGFLSSVGVAARALYFYICGCVPMLDKVIYDSFYFDNKHTYGFLSFNSVIRLLFNTLKIIGVDYSNSELYSHANSTIRKFEYTTQISNYGNYNAFTTYMSNFYVDGGIIGVLILSLLFGIVASVVYKNF